MQTTQNRSKQSVQAMPKLVTPTKIDLSVDVRTFIIQKLNESLSNAIDLQTQCKQAHWNVKGPSFIALHKLFDEINEAVEEYVDLLAERAVQLGGTVFATARYVASNTALPEYPLTIHDGLAHVEALSNALATFAKHVRGCIDITDDKGDACTADIYTEVARGTDQWLWFVEAHIQAKQ